MVKIELLGTKDDVACIRQAEHFILDKIPLAHKSAYFDGDGCMTSCLRGWSQKTIACMFSWGHSIFGFCHGGWGNIGGYDEVLTLSNR